MKKMKLHSIKLKITCWYTFVLTLVFVFVLGGIFMSSEIYSEEMIREELLDEVKDLEEEMMRYPEHFPRQDYVSYYDDGVLLSIYDENLEYTAGVIPEGLPEKTDFVREQMHMVQEGDEEWLLYEKPLILENGNRIWIRGAYYVTATMNIINRFIFFLLIVLVPLSLFTGVVSYHMMKKSLRPVSQITDTVNRITKSGDLSVRLQKNEIKDEFWYLITTFNEMLERLENQFLREKQFSSDAAHELRTPVASILLHCEYVLEEKNISDEVKEELTIIKNKTLLISKLVTQLLIIARTENENFKPEWDNVDLEILAESAIDDLSIPASEKEISMEVFSYLDGTEVEGNMTLLTRMFKNIIENGIAYGKKGGWIRIIMHRKDEGVLLQFADNGTGIAPGDLTKIWGRFFKTDTSRNSENHFGLGLYMVKQIVSCHRGRVWVESEQGRGTTFYVFLPGRQH